MGEAKGRRRYDREFKEGAVRLIVDSGRTVRGVARDLGIHENMLHRWKQEYLEEMKASFSSIGDHEVEEALMQAYAQSGYRDAMKSAADLLAARARKTYVLSMDVAMLYAIAGENAQALDWLERSFEERGLRMYCIGASVEFAPLRSYPRFQDLLRKMNLPVDIDK